MFEDGILERVGKLSKSVQQEFEANEDGQWLPVLRYVVEEPTKQQYPASKGLAPSDDLVRSYTRDLGHHGQMLVEFFNAQPNQGTGPGEIPKMLTMAEIAILRLYTGPWFKSINFYLRYLPEVRWLMDLFGPLLDPVQNRALDLCEATHIVVAAMLPLICSGCLCSGWRVSAGCWLSAAAKLLCAQPLCAAAVLMTCARPMEQHPYSTHRPKLSG